VRGNGSGEERGPLWRVLGGTLVISADCDPSWKDGLLEIKGVKDASVLVDGLFLVVNVRYRFWVYLLPGYLGRLQKRIAEFFVDWIEHGSNNTDE